MRKTILIIEDEEDLRTCLKNILTAKKCHVLEAANGAEALIILQTQHVDAILTDIDMPVKNGLEFLKEFRASNHTTPVIVMSGRLNCSEEELIQLGAVMFMQKPDINLTSILSVMAA